MTFRWFGSNNDTVPLHYVKQIPGVEGIVWALHDLPAGEVWPVDNIAAAMKEIQQAGFHGEVVESVNVHEDIKLGLPTRDQYIANYKQTIAHLAQFGVKIICYNFMPVFDWLRTNLHEPLEDGSTALFYEYARIASNSDPMKLVEVINADPSFTMPGWEPERLAHLTTLFDAYREIDEEQLFENARYFLQEIIPVAEQHGIRMAIHPDDPPWPIFGLPRIMTSQFNLQRYLELYDSPANALTLCSGSLGANPHNDIPAMIYAFADRIAFAHIRNVRVYENGNFIETSHRTQDGSVDITAIVEAYQTIGYEGYARPDHGRHIWDEVCRPGYGLYDRALGIMYLWGLWDAFEKQEAAQAPMPLTATV